MANHHYSYIHTRLMSYLSFVLLLILKSISPQSPIHHQQQKQQENEGQGWKRSLTNKHHHLPIISVSAFIIQPQFAFHRHCRLQNQFSNPLDISTSTTQSQTSSSGTISNYYSTSGNRNHKRNISVCHYSRTNTGGDDDDKHQNNSNSDENDKNIDNDANASINNHGNKSDNQRKNNLRNNDVDVDVDIPAMNHNEYNNTTPAFSSTLYEDEECYDLCDVFEEDISTSSENEQSVVEGKHDMDFDDSHEIHNNQESIPLSNANARSATSETADRSSTTSRSTPSSYKKEKEFNKDPEPTKQVWQNLELRWAIDESNEDCDVEDILSCSEPCPDCRGTGVVLCQFCNGHGYVDFGFAQEGTMGKRLLGNDNPNGRLGAECPVCNEDGEVKCQSCRGSGWIANWKLGNNSNISDLRP